MTHDELARELQAIEAALADRLTIVNTIINPDGTIATTYRKTIRLPRNDKRKTP